MDACVYMYVYIFIYEYIYIHMNSKMMRCGMASANTEHHLPNRTLRKPPQDKQEAPKQPQSKQRPGVGRGREGKQET